MQQLVGSACVICQQRIGSVVEGGFCEGCHGAVHNRCMQPQSAQLAEGRCSVCGANLSQVTAARQRYERERLARRGSKGNYPVSKLCPKCGNAEFKKRRPEKWIAFSWDRVCKACGTRYTPPTPVWAGVVFILAGLPLAGFGGLSVVARFISGAPVGLPAMACEGFLGFLGVLAIVQGIRALARPGRV